jgi:hypothetical protein
MIDKIKDVNFARFLGGFVSEGNLVDNGSLKITNQNLEFIDHLVKCAIEIFGMGIVTSKPPTPEHLADKSKFAYHKYLSNKLGRFLINSVGIKPGKRILNDDPLPLFVLEWSKNKEDLMNFKEWIKNYLQARFSGDGWVHLEKRWVGLTKVKALCLNLKLKKELLSLYSKGRKIKDYPKNFVEELKYEARKAINFPKEFTQLNEFLYDLFKIKSEVRSAGIRTIYFDKKRKIIIVSCIYHLLIHRKENVTKFKEEINFLELDVKNREKLNLILESYQPENVKNKKIAGPGFEPYPRLSF